MVMAATTTKYVFDLQPGDGTGAQQTVAGSLATHISLMVHCCVEHSAWSLRECQATQLLVGLGKWLRSIR